MTYNELASRIQEYVKVKPEQGEHPAILVDSNGNVFIIDNLEFAEESDLGVGIGGIDYNKGDLIMTE